MFGCTQLEIYLNGLRVFKDLKVFDGLKVLNGLKVIMGFRVFKVWEGFWRLVWENSKLFEIFYQFLRW